MDQQDKKLAKNTHVYGTNGPLVVETPDFKTKASLGFLKSANILGFPVKDINDGKQEITFGETCIFFSKNVKKIISA